MSPWPHSELRIALCPQQVTLLATRHGPGRRGPAERVELRCDGAGGPQPWQAPLAALAGVLPGMARGRAAATVFLSNQFLRYAVVPWRAELGGGSETTAYARHCFSRVYGKSCEHWELRLGRERPGRPRLASLLDPQLLEALRTAFAHSGVRLRSVQPHLMAAFNAARPQMQQRGGWLAMIEPGYLCVALSRNGDWLRVQGQRSDAAWQQDLLPLLQRECFLGEDGQVPSDVYVAAFADAAPALPKAAAWTFHALPARAPFLPATGEQGARA